MKKSLGSLRFRGRVKESNSLIVQTANGDIFVDKNERLVRNKSTGLFLKLDEYEDLVDREAVSLYEEFEDGEYSLEEFKEKLLEDERDFEFVSYSKQFEKWLSDIAEDALMRETD